MDAEPRRTADEIKQLRACINDLIGVVALPAIWSGGEPSEIVPTLLDVLLATLRLDFVYARVAVPVGEDSIELYRVAEEEQLQPQAENVLELVGRVLLEASWKGHPLAGNPLREGDMSLVPQRVGLRGEMGLIVAGSRRKDFPTPTERLLLNVASNQAAIGLQEARLLSEQKWLAHELEARVARRTTELASANEALRQEVAERRLVEMRLRQEERELKRSQALLAEAQRLSSTGSFTWRPDTDEITWSDESYRIFHIDRSTPLTFELIDDRVHPDDFAMYREQIARARSEKCDLEFDFRLRVPAVGKAAKEGAQRSVRYIHTVARASRDEQGLFEYIGAVQDVTERRISEESLSKVRSELAHVARASAVGVLTASIAHEVNQPLAGVITNAELCLKMLSAVRPDIEGALDTTRRTIRDGYRASGVISRLRTLFTKGTPTMAAVNLTEATQEVIALCSNELQRNRIVLRTELADDLPYVTGDRIQLQQVVLNLVLNAMEAMNGIAESSREIVIQTEEDQEAGVRLSVQDTGIGFDAQTAANLFEAFYTTKSGGMGIGLSVSRSIIESHGGRISARPNAGPGSTFYFWLPCRRLPRPVDEPMTAASALVSVVDDDHSIRESLPQLVRSWGFPVQSFASAEEFLASEYVERTGCLLLDIAMPGMSGPDLLRELSLRRPGIPTVMMTAQADDRVRPRMLELGAVECLFKPLGAHELLDAIKLALRAQ